ncbi:GHMP kinase [Sabulilitoribacter arenilitoris]|uniref:GHMP kinase n=1 Tax=Wocania arenilitoris TaxID=2044858 RepID=A0AAE3EPD4_9FLAO|nr:GYDIA family GHMP kinase [Wocania arenilitoris]MCF7567600.1 GHMP kinase [Wocania arenilitoris]
MERFYSNGKLLLTGEYVVLDGALSLAIPTKYGQSLEIEPFDTPKIIWTSFDEKETIWFECQFLIFREMLKQAEHDETSDKLIKILNIAKKLNPKFLSSVKGFKVTTKLDFPRHWGLGTSSTLINNIAKWAKVDAYLLLNKTFGGSGYDIACAQHNKPITYQLINSDMLKQVQHDKTRIIKEVNFNPSFKNQLYFVYLNQKQNSRDGIAQYKKNTSNLSQSISEINTITQNIITCKTLADFVFLIEKHEIIISKIIKQKPVKERLFNDFNGGIKSLGAWGGDFVLVASKDNPETYFKKKGFNTIIPYQDMIL